MQAAITLVDVRTGIGITGRLLFPEVSENLCANDAFAGNFVAGAVQVREFHRPLNVARNSLILYGLPSPDPMSASELRPAQNLAVLHDEVHMLTGRDVIQRIAGYGDDIGIEAGF